MQKIVVLRRRPDRVSKDPLTVTELVKVLRSKRYLSQTKLRALIKKTKRQEKKKFKRRNPWKKDQTFYDIVQDLPVMSLKGKELYVISCRVYREVDNQLFSMDIRKWVMSKYQERMPTYKGIRIPFSVIPELMKRMKALYDRVQLGKYNKTKEKEIFKK